MAAVALAGLAVAGASASLSIFAAARILGVITKTQGLQVLHDKEAAEPLVDIVCVHGLGGHPDRTWTCKSRGRNVNWIKDMLPKDLRDQCGTRARIMVYSYESDTDFSRYFPQTLSMHSRRLVAQLEDKRAKVSKDRPIIFIAHSLGGLIVKHSLVYASAANLDRDTTYKSLLLATVGVLFFGTPHREGSQLRWKKLLTRVMSVNRKITFADTFDPLPSQAELFELELDRYKSIEDKFLNYCFCEMSVTDTVNGKLGIYAVPKELARPLIETETWHIRELKKTHESLVKFESSHDPDYQLVVDALKHCLSYSGSPAQKCKALERDKDPRQRQRSEPSPLGQMGDGEGLSLNWRTHSFNFKSRMVVLKDLEEKVKNLQEELDRPVDGDGGFGLVKLQVATKLAQLYTDTDQAAEVEKLYTKILPRARKGLARVERDHGYHDRKTLRMVAALAHLDAVAGQYHKAESQNKRLLVEVQDLCGNFSLEHAFVLNQLAHNAYLQSDYEWASNLLLRVLNIQEAIYVEGEKHPESVRTIARLASIYDEQGKFPDAQRLYRKVIEFRETSGKIGPLHEDNIKTIENLAASYRLQGGNALREAVETYRTALERRKEVLLNPEGSTSDARDSFDTTLRQLYELYKELGWEDKLLDLRAEWDGVAKIAVQQSHPPRQL